MAAAIFNLLPRSPLDRLHRTTLQFSFFQTDPNLTWSNIVSDDSAVADQLFDHTFLSVDR